MSQHWGHRDSMYTTINCIYSLSWSRYPAGSVRNCSVLFVQSLHGSCTPEFITQPWLEWRNQLAFLACRIYLRPEPPAHSCQQQGQLAQRWPAALLCQGGLIVTSPNAAFGCTEGQSHPQISSGCMSVTLMPGNWENGMALLTLIT